ncbi:MAG: hypothetical protein COW16_09735 [Sphingomonadales bacterium CG12_big_fil_rev_8_21_14_0_65_65_10]|nr:MAG: hypothetical protein COW16_09735 [Sphingomonadales bacterium CG12_big_fil_rev_8_21_14_0_65_65_10]
MIRNPSIRKGARLSLALASTLFIGGGALIYFGSDTLGDVMMIVGGAMLLVAALVLAQTPTGDKDARR